jgi:hypothetical protein
VTGAHVPPRSEPVRPRGGLHLNPAGHPRSAQPPHALPSPDVAEGATGTTTTGVAAASVPAADGVGVTGAGAVVSALPHAARSSNAERRARRTSMGEGVYAGPGASRRPASPGGTGGCMAEFDGAPGLINTTVSSLSAWPRDVGRAARAGRPARLTVVAEGAARQPAQEDAGDREPDGGEGVGEVSLRPRDGAHRRDLALWPRGEKLATVRPRGRRRSRGRRTHGDASR